MREKYKLFGKLVLVYVFQTETDYHTVDRKMQEEVREKEKNAIILEAKENLIVAVSLYNTTLQRQEKNCETLTHNLWLGFILMFICYPTNIESSWRLFIFFSFFVFLSFVGFFLHFYVLLSAENVPLLEDPVQAAKHYYRNSTNAQSISLSAFINPSENVMGRLYDELITETMKLDRVCVLKTLSEAGLRYLMVDSILTEHVSIPMSYHPPPFLDRSEESEWDDYISEDE